MCAFRWLSLPRAAALGPRCGCWPSSVACCVKAQSLHLAAVVRLLLPHHVRQHAEDLDLVPDGNRVERVVAERVGLRHRGQGRHLLLALGAQQPHERQRLERVPLCEGHVHAVLLARVLLVEQPLLRFGLGEVRVHEHDELDVVQVPVLSRERLVRREAVVEQELLRGLLPVVAADLLARPEVLEGAHRQRVDLLVVRPRRPALLRVVHQVSERPEHPYLPPSDGQPEGPTANQHPRPLEIVEGDASEALAPGQHGVLPLEALLQALDRGLDGRPVERLDLAGAPEHGEVVSVLREDLEVGVVEALLLVPELQVVHSQVHLVAELVAEGVRPLAQGRSPWRVAPHVRGDAAAQRDGDEHFAFLQL
mmetsp:Transcript_35973/g.69884  ORF Transcript_35973/g.69884 Transcript_35973/m.69884 type:complete len:365 (+) Transcript_35973:343-1437(+)